jgi:hypothetical protein
MLNDSYTVALYLFSSFLQADAAILGLGIVFIVYRLQHLYNVYQPYVTLLLGCDLSGVPQECRKLLKGATEEEEKDILKRYKGHRFEPAFEFIIESQDLLRDIKRTFIPPLIVVAVHSIISGFSLWYLSFISQNYAACYVRVWGGIVSIGFLFSLLEIVAGAQVAFEVKPIIKGFPLSSRFIKQSDLK